MTEQHLHEHTHEHKVNHETTSHEEKSFMQKFEHALGGKKVINIVFLGVGLTLFLLNISGILSFLPRSYNITAFDVSVFSSIVIIIYATYALHEEN